MEFPLNSGCEHLYPNLQAFVFHFLAEKSSLRQFTEMYEFSSHVVHQKVEYNPLKSFLLIPQQQQQQLKTHFAFALSLPQRHSLALLMLISITFCHLSFSFPLPSRISLSLTIFIFTTIRDAHVDGLDFLISFFLNRHEVDVVRHRDVIPKKRRGGENILSLMPS
jgi:hypothetical protein